MPFDGRAPACASKRRFDSRMGADSALRIARYQWRKRPDRAPAPPVRVYRCGACKGWHMTHTALRADA